MAHDLGRWRGWFYGRTRAALVPELRHSQYEYADRLSEELPADYRWLDLGCGHSVIPDWISSTAAVRRVTGGRLVGIDTDRTALARHRSHVLKVHGSAEALPFSSDSFELVSANMVLEHLVDPGRVFAEVARVLVRGGRFLVHTPNRSGYTTRLTRLVPRRWRAPLAHLLHGRFAEDVYPAYYRANTPGELRTLAAAAGLSVSSLAYVQTSAQLMAIPPLVLMELLLLRALERPGLERWRADLIAVFRKP